MRITSLRLGDLEVPQDKIITMERPILGFESLSQFCLVETPDMAPFLWLQSLENEAVSFVVVNPIVFWPSYRIEINPKEIAELNVETPESVETYVIVTFDRDPKNMTANLQGPILINTENSLAKQLILVNSEYEVCHSIIEAIESMPDAARTAEPVVEVEAELVDA